MPIKHFTILLISPLALSTHKIISYVILSLLGFSRFLTEKPVLLINFHTTNMEIIIIIYYLVSAVALHMTLIIWNPKIYLITFDRKNPVLQFVRKIFLFNIRFLAEVVIYQKRPIVVVNSINSRCTWGDFYYEQFVFLIKKNYLVIFLRSHWFYV